MSKISELSDGGALQSTDYLIAVRSGGNVKVQPNGTVTGTTGSFSGNVTFADNAKAIFGAGSDLQIYHDGSNSYIDETATGHLFIRSNGDGIYLRSSTNEEIAHFNVNGSVKAYYDNSLKLETTSTGIDVTGTVTADGLTLASGSQAVIGVFGTSGLQLIGQSGSDNIVGTMGASEPLIFRTASVERMRIDSSGNVGIGVTPSAWGGGFTTLQAGASGAFSAGNYSSVGVHVSGNAYYDGTNWKYIATDEASNYYQSDGKHVWRTAASGTAGNTISFSEAMRIDSSGNLLVGKTVTTFSTEGIVGFNPSDANGPRVNITNDGGATLNLNRLTSDGDIAIFYKDGTTVGSIGTGSSSLGRLQIGTGDTQLYFQPDSDYIGPSNGTAPRDAAIDIGYTTARWKDLYLSGGVYLGGTVTANLLDDYEEGTWTPSWAGTTTAGTPTGTFTGRYTKIGNVVTVWANISGANLTGATGILAISGLPFAPAAAAAGSCYLEGVTPTYTATPPTGAGLSVHVYTSTQLAFKPSISTSWDNYLLANSTFTGGGGSTYGWLTITYDV